jgi:hypothetical protein
LKELYKNEAPKICVRYEDLSGHTERQKRKKKVSLQHPVAKVEIKCTEDFMGKVRMNPYLHQNARSFSSSSSSSSSSYSSSSSSSSSSEVDSVADFDDDFYEDLETKVTRAFRDVHRRLDMPPLSPGSPGRVTAGPVQWTIPDVWIGSIILRMRIPNVAAMLFFLLAKGNHDDLHKLGVL